MTGKWHKQQIK